MTWATFSQSIQDHMTLDPKHGVHSALLIRSQPTVNAASSSSSSTSSASTHESGPEPKRQHREINGIAYATNAAPSYDELQAKVAAYERQAQPNNGQYQYPPQNTPQQPRYQQFQQNQQYRQQGAQYQTSGNTYRRGSGGCNYKQPVRNGHQQQQQQQNGSGGYTRYNQRKQRERRQSNEQQPGQLDAVTVNTTVESFKAPDNKDEYLDEDEWEPYPGSA